MNFNPEWTVKEAILTIKEHGDGPGSPFYSWWHYRKALASEETYINGDPCSLMEAIYFCSKAEIPLPLWASKEFRKAYQRVLSLDLESNSWDEVFGTPYPKGTHLNARKKKRQYRFAVYQEVEKLRNPWVDALGREVKYERPIGPDIFEEVGSRFGLGKTLTEELYYEAKNILSRE